jgi:hypothetical protein
MTMRRDMKTIQRRLFACALLVGLCLTSQPSQAAPIAFVNRAHFSSAAIAMTVASPATSHAAGNLLVALVQWQVNNFSSIANTAADTWTEAVSARQDTGSNRHRIYYAYNSLGHATDVVTVTFSAADTTYRMITVLQFSGALTTDPLDDADQATGNSAAPATPSLTVRLSKRTTRALVLGAGLR